MTYRTVLLQISALNLLALI